MNAPSGGSLARSTPPKAGEGAVTPPPDELSPVTEGDVPRSYIAADVRFAIIPEWLLFSDVSDGAIRLFATLHRFDGDEGIFPARKKLAALCRCSVRTIDRHIEELVNAGALKVESRFDSAGDQKSNMYYLFFSARGGVTGVATPSSSMSLPPSSLVSPKRENELTREREREATTRAGAREESTLIEIVDEYLVTERRPDIKLNEVAMTVLWAMPAKYQRDPDTLDSIRWFGEAYADRHDDVVKAIAECKKAGNLPWPKNLRALLEPKERDIQAENHAMWLEYGHGR